MSSIQALKSGYDASCYKVVDWHGQTLGFRKIGADKAIALADNIAAREGAAPLAAMIEPLVEILALSLVNPETKELDCDNDEGRAFLRTMPLSTLQELVEIASEHSGFGSAPKETAKKN